MSQGAPSQRPGKGGKGDGKGDEFIFGSFEAELGESIPVAHSEGEEVGASRILEPPEGS
jgi:hypothetical protein